MKIIQMRYFSACCHSGTISRAAEELHVSQPSVTASIKALEDELGVSLLHRGNRAVTPTPDGERFLQQCDDILSRIDHLSDEFAELRESHRTIHVGIPPMIGSILFPEVFTDFRSKHPRITINPVEIGSQAAREAVVAGDLDLAVITMGEDQPVRLNTLQLATYEMMYCVGKKHPLANKKLVTIKETADYPMILFSGGYYQNFLLNSRFKTYNVNPEILFHSNQLTTIKSFIRKGIAAGFIMQKVILPEDQIVTIPVAGGLPLNVNVIWRKDDYLSREAEAFVSFCRRTFLAAGK